MALPITKNEIDSMREWLKVYAPYDENDSIFTEYDGEAQPDESARMKATSAKRVLEAYGLDPYDPSDYGDITD